MKPTEIAQILAHDSIKPPSQVSLGISQDPLSSQGSLAGALHSGCLLEASSNFWGKLCWVVFVVLSAGVGTQGLTQARQTLCP